jgi:hypothetical protein
MEGEGRIRHTPVPAPDPPILQLVLYQIPPTLPPVPMFPRNRHLRGSRCGKGAMFWPEVWCPRLPILDGGLAHIYQIPPTLPPVPMFPRTIAHSPHDSREATSRSVPCLPLEG